MATLAMTAPATAQQQLLELTTQTAAAEVSGAASRTWIVESISKHMGSGSCLKGKTLRFKSDKTMRMERCVDGKMVATTHRWRVEAGAPDILLLIDNRPFRIRIRAAGGDREMLLTVAQHSKALLHEDTKLRLSRD